MQIDPFVTRQQRVDKYETKRKCLGSVPIGYHKANIDIICIARQICVQSQSLQNTKKLFQSENRI